MLVLYFRESQLQKELENSCCPKENQTDIQLLLKLEQARERKNLTIVVWCFKEEAEKEITRDNVFYALEKTRETEGSLCTLE